MNPEPAWMIRGAIKAQQSVTPAWEPIKDLIEGVRICEPKNVPTGYGSLVEVFRQAWFDGGEPIGGIFQATFMPGAISAWHAHAKTIDRIFVNRGALLIAMYSKEHDKLNVLRFSEHRPGLVIMPPGIWHGVMNVGSGEASLINAVSHAYEYSDPDHYRLPAGTDQIPYNGFREALKRHPQAALGDPFDA